MPFSHTILVYSCLLATALTACQNGDDIGDLYGQWQLTDTSQPTECAPTTAFLAFQNDVVIGRYLINDHAVCLLTGLYTRTADSLIMNFYQENVDQSITPEELTTRFGFTPSADRSYRFALSRLSASHLDLAADHDQRYWHFQKW